MGRRRSGLALAAACVLCSCAPPASQGGFDSDNPAARLYAIQRAGVNRDHAAIKPLVESLDSDDPAVRMMAIGALQRITGQTMGYDPFAEPKDRYPAVEAWRKALLNHRFDAPGVAKTAAAAAAPTW